MWLLPPPVPWTALIPTGLTLFAGQFLFQFFGIAHGMPHCIRVMMHFNGDQTRNSLHHVYLEGARSLRDDLPE